ncbi:hypothetical protein ATT74_25340 [Salmonella enterica subsp. enterica serovar Panama]|uniref:Uncharacterized protein n=1 Tax=Salmonella enterica subsp. enterica serovar Panama TaxID=29472 RepID=A0A619AFP0_SALET|nr:hypothetical protein [Salmonella enterica subsp. enterica serovar Panama]ECX3498096.1 hypothetical protein [Salmonella enterica subsp. enterica serovar Panama]ECX6035278.1 hypothetical protein [Salmonella enterica subsp. enterica serovar Panama]EGU5383823.1 hypothetical protein [Salmonella enterica]EGX1720294.1 hypothetical protein [Salmonella enterica subsp. enterica serovar Panama]
MSESTYQHPKPRMWETELKNWEQTMSQQELGLHLSFILHKFVQPELHPILEDITKCFQYPEDTLRWEIFEKAQTLGFDTPTGALALALFWSHGSMSPEGLEPVYPDPSLVPQMLHCVSVMCVTKFAEIPEHGTQLLISHSVKVGGT